MPYFIALFNVYNDPMSHSVFVTQLIRARNKNDAIDQLIHSSDNSIVERIIYMILSHGAIMECFSKFNVFREMDLDINLHKAIRQIRRYSIQIHALLSTISKSYFRIDKAIILRN